MTTARVSVSSAAALLAGAALITPGAFWDSDEPASLAVTIADVPGDSRTPVVVSGPDGYRVEMTRTTLLRNLEPGDYTVAAANVPNPLGEMVPQLSPQTIRLTAGDDRGVAVTYRFEVPALAAKGDPNAYAIQTGNPNNAARWNPCRTITWGPLSPLPAEEEARLTQAFAKASIASGIPFRRVAPGESPQVSVNLTFVPGNRVEGEGQMDYRTTSDDGRATAYRGFLEGRIGTETSGALREALYLHEIGHVLGITHVDDPTQVMHQVVDEADAAGFAAGDTNGLRLVGAAAGCLDTPLGAKEVRGTVDGDELTVSWFQPGSVPPVLGTSVRLSTKAAGVRLSSDPAWQDGFTGNGAGAMSATATVPPTVCDPGTTVTIAARNAHGTTETPVVLSGCPRR